MTSASFDRILCPTDFSVFSGLALRHAMADHAGGPGAIGALQAPRTAALCAH